MKTPLTPNQKIIVAALEDNWRLIRHPLGCATLISPKGKNIYLKWKTIKALLNKNVVHSERIIDDVFGSIFEYKFTELFLLKNK